MLRRLSLVLALFAALTTFLTAPAVAAEEAVTVRGGDVLYSGDLRCRVAFNAHAGTTSYGLMPGHCASTGDTWTRDPAGSEPVGTTAGSSFPSGDHSVLQYFDTVDAPSEVAVGASNVSITGAGNPSVGARICLPSLSGGLHCGTITAVNISVSYPNGVVSGLFSANLCVEPGDLSGGPGFSGNIALGVAVGAQGDCSSGGVTYFQPVVAILSAYGLSIG